jgi:hypothetical protein
VEAASSVRRDGEYSVSFVATFQLWLWSLVLVGGFEDGCGASSCLHNFASRRMNVGPRIKRGARPN